MQYGLGFFPSLPCHSFLLSWVHGEAKSRQGEGGKPEGGKGGILLPDGEECEWWWWGGENCADPTRPFEHQ